MNLRRIGDELDLQIKDDLIMGCLNIREKLTSSRWIMEPTNTDQKVPGNFTGGQAPIIPKKLYNKHCIIKNRSMNNVIVSDGGIFL